MQDVIHVLSATAIYADETRNPNRTTQLSMCQVRVGPYAEASKVHPVGNFMFVPPVGPHSQAEWDRVTCKWCRAVMLGRANRACTL